jgi:hypothetical protein
MVVVGSFHELAVQEIVVAPTRQRDTSTDLEISRWAGAPVLHPS